MTKPIIAQGLFHGSEYFLFRPLGNDSYREIKFEIRNGRIVENPTSKLWENEKNYIKDNFFGE